MGEEELDAKLEKIKDAVVTSDTFFARALRFSLGLCLTALSLAIVAWALRQAGAPLPPPRILVALILGGGVAGGVLAVRRSKRWFGAIQGIWGGL